jgi:DNA gyrase subunit A
MAAVTSHGTLHTFHPMDLPDLSPTSVTLAQGVPINEYLGLAPSDGQVVGVFSLEEEPTIVLGTQAGVVKRVTLTGLPDRPVTSVITLKDGDTVRGAALSPDDSNIVFITDAAQLLHYPATAVRPQGLQAGGMTGITLPEGTSVLWCGAANPHTATVVTLSGSRAVLPGTEALRIKQSSLSEFPAKGRATSGVRAHTFLKGEDVLVLASVIQEPRLMTSAGKPVEISVEKAKRDASGTALDVVIGHIGEALA